MMKNVTLGKTGITVPQNGFGALPIQRADKDTAVLILRRAFEGGITFFDTARAYSDSEEKIGLAFGDMWPSMRDKMILATKTQATDPETFWEHLNKSLELLKTDYIDIYQFHCVSKCYRPGDGTGMYEAICEAKEKGLIRHIGITTHKIELAFEILESGLYETLQYPFSYLASEKETELVKKAEECGVGFIAMKGLAGGLITDSKAAFAFMSGFDNVIPIWGIQRMNELEEWLSFFNDTPVMDKDMEEFIVREQENLKGEFCRGCGYCMPCPFGVDIPGSFRFYNLSYTDSYMTGVKEYFMCTAMKDTKSMASLCKQCGRCETHCPQGIKIRKEAL